MECVKHCLNIEPLTQVSNLPSPGARLSNLQGSEIPDLLGVAKETVRNVSW